MRALALTNPPPAAVLTGLDRVFDATEEEEQVTTLAYMVVEPVTGEGTLALAGHPPPVLVSPQGTAVLGDVEPGTPLGWPTSRRQFRFVGRRDTPPCSIQTAWWRTGTRFGRRTRRALQCCDRSAA